jgi:glycosyltransferase involved in cell wall biosynthesis
MDAESVFAGKQSDIFFSGRGEGDSTLRAQGLAELRALSAEGVRVDIPDSRLPSRDYYRRMSRAWLAWSPSGRGWECYRHFEAPHCLSVPVINYPTIVRHAPLQQEVHAIFYSPEPGGLREAVLKALSHKENLQRTATAARAHVTENHTFKAHCEMILNEVLGPAA